MIEYVITNYDKFEFLRKKLQTIRDIEHLYRKIIFNKISPTDLYSFNQNLNTILEINNFMKKDKTMQRYIKNNIGTKIESICKHLQSVLERNLNMEVCKNLVI